MMITNLNKVRSLCKFDDLLKKLLYIHYIFTNRTRLRKPKLY